MLPRRTLALAVPFAGFLVGCTPLPEVRPVLLQGDVAAVDDREEDDYRAGKHHLAAGELGLAVGRFRAAVARNYTDVAALNALAACYDRLGRFDLADRYYDRALAVAPDDAQTLNNAGVSQLMRGSSEQAIVLLERAARVSAENATVAANLERARAVASAFAAAPDHGKGEPRDRISRVGMTAWMVHTRPAEQTTALPLAVQREAHRRPPLDLRILNGVGRRSMAARFRTWLRARGYQATDIGDARPFNTAETVLTYAANRGSDARKLAALLPRGIRLQAADGPQTGLTLVLGRDLMSFDDSISKGGI